MARTGKIIAQYRRGQGKHNVERWSTFRCGPLHDQRDSARADLFVDVNPYVSLAGIDADRLYSRAAATHIDQHAIARTRGKTLRTPPMARQREHMIAGSHKKDDK
jgi:hypothetical protein